MARFWVTPRTKSPRRVRASVSHMSASTTNAKPMITMRLHGSTMSVRTSMPPDMNAGFST